MRVDGEEGLDRALRLSDSTQRMRAVGFKHEAKLS